jgi:hypothetical protein
MNTKQKPALVPELSVCITARECACASIRMHQLIEGQEATCSLALTVSGYNPTAAAAFSRKTDPSRM